MSASEEMPCPVCKRKHVRGEYGPRPDLQKPGKGMPHSPPQVTCPCGAVLEHTVPLFLTDPYGWHWGVMDFPGCKKE